MTTIAAVKKGNKACIVADSLTIFGNTKELAGMHVLDDPKIISIGPNFIGAAGHPSWGLILEHYCSKKGKIHEWRSVDEIFDIFSAFHQDLKDKYFLERKIFDFFFPFESSEFELLILNTYGIFEVEYSRMVRKYTRYSAIGTGEDYALGAMSAIYNIIEDPLDIASVGIKSAAHFDLKTALPMHGQTISFVK